MSQALEEVRKLIISTEEVKKDLLKKEQELIKN